MMFDGHGVVHLSTGGANSPSCAALNQLEDVVGHANYVSMLENIYLLSRSAWRYGLCVEPSKEDCAGDVSALSCKLSCAGCDSDEFTSEQVDAYTNLFRSWEPISAEATQSALRTMFCDTRIISGDSTEGSSPSDWSFWAIHPTVERLTQYKQLVNPLTDYTWDATDYYGWETCKWATIFDVDCNGHYETDATVNEMTIFDDEADAFVAKHPTIREVVVLTKPENHYKLPYVYDNFEYVHCEESGLEFKEVPKK
jgi:hypothetical protein